MDMQTTGRYLTTCKPIRHCERRIDRDHWHGIESKLALNRTTRVGPMIFERVDVIRSLNEISRIRLYMLGSISIWLYPLRKSSCLLLLQCLCRLISFLRKSPCCSIFNLRRSEIFECPIWTEQMTCSVTSAQSSGLRNLAEVVFL
jgi:hypothetical protein